MHKIIIDTNSIQYGNNIVPLRTRYLQPFLSLLLQNHCQNRPLDKKSFDAYLFNTFSVNTLQRVQILRLLKSVREVLLKLGIEAQLQYNVRKESSGPWWLSYKGILDVEDRTLKTASLACSVASRYFNVTNPHSTLAHNQHLLDFLMRFVEIRALMKEGYFSLALEKLTQINTDVLTNYAKAKITLLHIKILNHLGQYQQAIKLIQALFEQGYDESTEIGSMAQVSLYKISYQLNGTSEYEDLLQRSYPPKMILQQDNISLMHWHNNQALLLRRYILGKSESFSDHQQALFHLEEAIFIAIWLDNLELLLDFVLNYTFHLQKMLPLAFSELTEILRWYKLSMFIQDKLDSGSYSEWDKIFFARFYLENIHAINQLPPEELDCIMFGTPWQAAFYHQALARLQESGDLRQKAIMLLSYFEYATYFMNKAEQKVIAQQIELLLFNQATLISQLFDDGYGYILDQVETVIL